MPSFSPGQRWSSETEPELGPGAVIRVEDRTVTLRFAISEEIRCYASANPPLERVIFHVGDTISPAGGDPFTITAVTEEDGLFIYSGTGMDVPETHMADIAPRPRPEDRLFRGQADEPELFALRCRTWRHRARIASSPVHGFAGCRIDLIPHQLFIARAAATRVAPRLLLADEVGLGKTIEACLIMHRMLITGRIGRVLILVPDVLIHQWLVELLRRFNVRMNIYDEERCVAVAESCPSENPFLDEQLVLSSESFFRDHPERRQQALAAGWDLLIVDEAHHLEWTPDHPSVLYSFVADLAASVQNVLLLTATPEELGPESHFARLKLLDPERYTDLDTFLKDSAGYAETAREAERLIEQGKPVDELLDRYGPGRVMFRNTRRHIPGFPQRKLHSTILSEGQTKQAWLADCLKSLGEEKVLVICNSMRAVNDLASALPRKLSIPTALFHEDMNLIQRDRSAAWFSEPDGARLMIASPIGGEGRNFQFAHHLVLYDLPESPELLEQRIGRLDRIGQRETIHLHVACIENSREENILRWMRDGLQAFEKCLQGGSEIYHVFKDRLDGPVEELVKDTRTYRTELERRLEEGSNRLLEMHSFNEEIAHDVIRAIRELDEDPALEPYLLHVCEHFGIHAEAVGPQSWQLSPGPTFRDSLPGFNKEGMIVTLSRSRALDREDWTFLTWDHPILSSAMDAVITSREGVSTLVVALDPPTPLCLEAVFILEVTAPPALVADRFLPSTLIRVTLDMTGQSIENFPLDLPDARRPGLFSGDGPLSDRVRILLEQAEDVAREPVSEARESAHSTMSATLGAERARLAHLASINDHVHPDELEALDDRIRRLASAITDATVRLDAVRVIIPDQD